MKGPAAPSAAVGVPSAVDTGLAKKKIVQRKVQVVKKLTSRKFVKPGKFVPMSRAAAVAKAAKEGGGTVQGRRAPLQPGELQRKIYGEGAGGGMAPLVARRRDPQHGGGMLDASEGGVSRFGGAVGSAGGRGGGGGGGGGVEMSGLGAGMGRGEAMPAPAPPMRKAPEVSYRECSLGITSNFVWEGF